MKSPFLSMVAGLLMCLFSVRAEDPLPAAPTVNPAGSIPSEARHLGVEALRPFAKEGFHVRDGEWSVELNKGVPRFLQVTLFAGERYRFAAASPVRGGKLRLTLFDASGKEVKSEAPKAEEQFTNGGGTAMVTGIAPKKSGNYFVGMELAESPVSGPCEVSLIYAYK